MENNMAPKKNIKKKLNIALVGCGRISDVHVPGYKDNPDARIYAVCDTDKKLAEIRAAKWKAEKVYLNYNELLADPELDAVEILTPQHLHEPMTVAAARAGKHVAVQKPMSISLQSADRMISACNDAGVVFKVTENYVFYPPILKARELILSGAIGEVSGIRIRLISGSSGGWDIPASAWEWRMKETAEGRGLNTFDHGHHLWSTAWFLLGASDRVNAWIESSDGVVDSPSIIMWKYRDGQKMGVCDLVHGNELNIPSKYYANDEWMEIAGQRGIIFIRRCTGNIHSGPVLSLFDGSKIKNFNIPSDWGLGFIGATHNFINAILKKENSILNGEQGREILRFALAIAKSSKLHREVYLDEMDAAIPSLYAWRKRQGWRLKRISEKINIPFLSGNLSGLAPQAETLTEKLLERFDADAAKGWKIEVGLVLLADGGVPEQSFTLSVSNSKVRLIKGKLSEKAALTLRSSAGTWAGILLGKKRIELALIQGKLKAEGRLEEGLRLRSVFKI
jgi:predicted dehydrogenase